MKKVLILMLSVSLLIVASCKKDNKPDEKFKTPLHMVLDQKFIVEQGNMLIVNYTAYNSSRDLDAKVLNAAQNTADGDYGFSRVVIKGKNLDTHFDKGSKKIPYAYFLTDETTEFHKGTSQKPWSGIITIETTNGNITEADFLKNVEIIRIGGSIYSNDGIYTDFFEKKVVANKMTLKFGETNKSLGIYFKVISKVPVNFKVQYDIEYSFDGLTNFLANIPEEDVQHKISSTPTTWEIIGGLYPTEAIRGFQFSLADYYWGKNVAPFL